MFNYLLSATLCALSLLFTSASDLCGCKGTLFLRHIQEFMSLFCKNLIFFCLVHSDNVLSSTWFPPGPKGCSMDAERVLNGSTYYPEHPFIGSFVHCTLSLSTSLYLSSLFQCHTHFVSYIVA